MTGDNSYSRIPAIKKTVSLQEIKPINSKQHRSSTNLSILTVKENKENDNTTTKLNMSSRNHVSTKSSAQDKIMIERMGKEISVMKF